MNKLTKFKERVFNVKRNINSNAKATNLTQISDLNSLMRDAMDILDSVDELARNSESLENADNEASDSLRIEQQNLMDTEDNLGELELEYERKLGEAEDYVLEAEQLVATAEEFSEGTRQEFLYNDDLYADRLNEAERMSVQIQDAVSTLIYAADNLGIDVNTDEYYQIIDELNSAANTPGDR
tara:strand:- start:3045 stop:3593 length:549 start_codon:yes stop_codon:yes gene_type:complete